MRVEKLIKKRDLAEEKMNKASSVHDFDRWHYEYHKILNKLRGKEGKK